MNEAKQVTLAKEKPNENQEKKQRTPLARASLAASASAAIALCNITGSRASLLVIVFFISSINQI